MLEDCRTEVFDVEAGAREMFCLIRTCKFETLLILLSDFFAERDLFAGLSTSGSTFSVLQL